MGCDTKTQAKTGPVMDRAHPCEGKYQARKPKCPHQQDKFEESGDEADQEKDSHAEIQAPSDNLHVHINHTLLI